MQNKNITSLFKTNISSGLVVYLVALPLCLGIAVASGAPPLSGIISGIIGGIVVGWLSNSHISVSGPAAGLTAILISGISDLGSFELILLAGMIAGIIQIILGFLKAGAISRFFPSNVIEGMLGGIGVIIVMKQLEAATGWTGNFQNEEIGLLNQITMVFSSLSDFIHPGAILITIVSLLILIGWNNIGFLKRFNMIPAALVAVIAGIAINAVFINLNSSLAQEGNMLVSIPIAQSVSEFGSMFTFPDFSGFTNSKVWIIGITIAVVASIETLLCIEAADKMDEEGRITNTNRELKAQGIGNLISSLIGGLPMTSVVVRSSANAKAGATSKLSAIIHGMFLLISIILLPVVINMIPMATLAAVLILVGYKLARPSLFIHFWKKGLFNFIPFFVTLIAVVMIDLLSGVALGLLTFVIIKAITDRNNTLDKIRMIFFKLKGI